jgi:phage portal protein BeeE
MAGLLNIGRIFNGWFDALVNDENKKVVSPVKAMSYAPVWYAVNKISGHMGQLPLVLHRGLERGAERATDDYRYMLCKKRPNYYQTPMQFKQSLQANCLMYGNGFAWIRRAGTTANSRILDLLPLDSAKMAIVMWKGEKWYLYDSHKDEPIRKYRDVDMPEDPDIPGSGGLMVIADSEMCHFPGLGFDGFAGFSLWKIANDNWAIGIAADKLMKSGFDKGFRSSMLLEAPANMFRDEKQAREFLEGFRKQHGGPDQNGNIGLLREGIKANVVSMNSRDAEINDSRQFSREDVALWFCIETILGDDSTSYNGIEQRTLAYLSNCLAKWLKTWEEELDRKLLTEREQAADVLYFKFHDRALLRTDYSTTINSLSTGINARIYSPNEARELLDLNPYEGGDVYANPAITPGTGDQIDEDDDPEDDMDESDTGARAMRVVISRVQSVEKNRVIKGCKSKNFVDWVDGFYARFTSTISEAIRPLLDDRSEIAAETIATEYTEASKSALLDAAGNAKDEAELVAIVGETVAGWDSRVDQILNAISEQNSK